MRIVIDLFDATLPALLRSFETRAKAASGPGIVWTGTNTLDTNASGNTKTNPADCAASAPGTFRPTSTNTHEKAKPNIPTTSTEPTAASGPAVNRNPMR